MDIICIFITSLRPASVMEEKVEKKSVNKHHSPHFAHGLLFLFHPIFCVFPPLSSLVPDYFIMSVKVVFLLVTVFITIVMFCLDSKEN